MKLKHSLDLQIDSRDGLIALGMILLAFVAVALGTVALSDRPVQEGSPEVTLRARCAGVVADALQVGWRQVRAPCADRAGCGIVVSLRCSVCCFPGVAESIVGTVPFAQETGFRT